MPLADNDGMQIPAPPVVKRFPFATLPTEDRARAAEAIRLARRRMRGGLLLRGYTFWTGNLLSTTEAELRNRAAGGQPVFFLDAGAGRGDGVRDALRLAGNIAAYGLAPHRLGARLPKNSPILGHFEGRVIPGFFDVIPSRFALQHALNVVGLENLLNSLKPGGCLIYRPAELPFLTLDLRSRASLDTRVRLIKTLSQQGFTFVQGYGEDSMPVGKITKTDARTADLSSFYGHKTLNIIPITNARRAPREA